jgi:hypothetical protein
MRAKAWASFSRGRGTLGTNVGELDWAKSAGHCGRAPAKPKLAEHIAQKGKLGMETCVSPRGGARGGLARSPASWMVENAVVGLRWLLAAWAERERGRSYAK